MASGSTPSLVAIAARMSNCFWLLSLSHLFLRPDQWSSTYPWSARNFVTRSISESTYFFPDSTEISSCLFCQLNIPLLTPWNLNPLAFITSSISFDSSVFKIASYVMWCLPGVNLDQRLLLTFFHQWRCCAFYLVRAFDVPPMLAHTVCPVGRQVYFDPQGLRQDWYWNSPQPCFAR